jgi:hypothetical protein
MGWPEAVATIGVAVVLAAMFFGGLAWVFSGPSSFVTRKCNKDDE